MKKVFIFGAVFGFVSLAMASDEAKENQHQQMLEVKHYASTNDIVNQTEEQREFEPKIEIEKIEKNYVVKEVEEKE